MARRARISDVRSKSETPDGPYFNMALYGIAPDDPQMPKEIVVDLSDGTWERSVAKKSGVESYWRNHNPIGLKELQRRRTTTKGPKGAAKTASSATPSGLEDRLLASMDAILQGQADLAHRVEQIENESLYEPTDD